MLYTVSRFMRGMAQMRDEMATELEGNPFAGLGELAMSSAQLQWGWVVLFAGVGLILYASLRARAP